jgi:hypothetical protein
MLKILAKVFKLRLYLFVRDNRYVNYILFLAEGEALMKLNEAKNEAKYLRGWKSW